MVSALARLQCRLEAGSAVNRRTSSATSGRAIFSGRGRRRFRRRTTIVATMTAATRMTAAIGIRLINSKRDSAHGSVRIALADYLKQFTLAATAYVVVRLRLARPFKA